MGRLLVIDGGRSRCRVAVLGPGKERESSAEGRGLPAGAGVAGLAQAVGEAVALAGVDPRTVDAAGAGLAGLLGAPEQAAELAPHLSSRLGVERIVLAGDVVAAYAGALGPVPGVVLSAGTGAVALGVTTASDGTTVWARTDGWGHLLGDAGSGHWIGRRGLEAALRAHDGRGGSAVLAGLAESHVGPLDSLPRRIAATDRPVAVVAGFAPRVADAARRGDTAARVIWAEAAGELAATTAACVRRLFPAGAPVPVSWSGGLFAASDLLLDAFLARLAELAPDSVPTPPEGDALDGAALLAATPGLLRPLVHDPGAGTPSPPAETNDPVLT